MAQARILVVDDTPEVRMLVCRILGGLGYNVLEASDATEALAACDQTDGEIDLLLTDIKMPGMDGIELAGSLTTAHPGMRVLFISGECDESELQLHIARKGFEFLSKPFMPHLLVEAVHNILPPAKRPPMSAGRLRGEQKNKTGLS